VLLVILESVEILVSLSASVTAVWFFFLHSERSRVWHTGGWIDYGKCAVIIGFEFLILVTVLNDVSKMIYVVRS